MRTPLPAEPRSKPRLLALAIGCAGIATAWANAGLTSAGVNQPQNGQQDEPTLAQVAPIQNAAGNGQAASQAVPGTNPSAAAQAGVVAGTNAAGADAAGGNAAAAAKPAPPPAPPDPSKLPISVIRPLNKAPAAPPPDAAAAAPVQSKPPPHRIEPAAAAPPRPAGAAPQASAPPPILHRPGPALPPARAPDAARPAAEPAASGEAAADAGSSGFIFYTGIGTAAAILLLSLAAFFRGGSEDGTKSRLL
jgi:hypothetical protein